MLDAHARAQSHDLRQHQRKCTVMFELSVTLERVLEFLALEIPEAFLDSSSMDLRRLTESLLFVLGHTTSGPDAQLFERALATRLAPLDKVSRAPILAPIAGIILNLDEAEERAAALEGTEPTPRDSIRAELARTRADVSQLEYLCDFPWKDHFAAEDSSSGRLERLKDFVRRVKHSRAQVELEEERDDARDIPEEFVDPIMQTIMTDPVTLRERADCRSSHHPEAPARRSDRSIQSVAAGREHARAGGRTARANRTVAEGGAGRCAEPGGCGLGRENAREGGPNREDGWKMDDEVQSFSSAGCGPKVGTVF